MSPSWHRPSVFLSVFILILICIVLIVLSVHTVSYIYFCTRIPVSASEPRFSIISVQVIYVYWLTFISTHVYLDNTIQFNSIQFNSIQFNSLLFSLITATCVYNPQCWVGLFHVLQYVLETVNPSNKARKSITAFQTLEPAQMKELESIEDVWSM